MPLLTTGIGAYVIASGGGLDPATTAWITAVTTAGGTVSGTQQTRVDTLIKALKSASLFSVLDRMWLWGGESVTQQATIDLIHNSTLTVSNAPTFSASGYTGNAFNTVLDSGVQPSTFSGNHTLNSASYGFYETDNGAASNSNYHGTNGTAPQTVIGTYVFATLTVWAVNNGAFNTVTNTAATTQGMWGTSRTSSSATAVYRNGSSTPLGSNGSDTSTSLPISNIQWLQGNSLTGNNAALAAGWIGGGLTGAQYASLASALNAYMTSWGINVF